MIAHTHINNTIIFGQKSIEKPNLGKPKFGNLREKNTRKNLVRNFLTPQEIPDTTYLQKLTSLTLCIILCVALHNLLDLKPLISL